MKSPTPASKPTDPKIKSFPQCMNKKQARMVCLNDKCEDYAFFCLQCDDQSCEAMHRHVNKEDKYEAISFKEFIRRVLRERKPIEELDSAISTYRNTLERLRTDINEFVEKELKNLTDIVNKVTEVPEELSANIKKLQNQQYAGLKGLEMDFLWKNSGDSQEIHRMQVETADFIKIKEEELKAISEHFENLNKMEIDKIEDVTESPKNTIDATKPPQTKAKSPSPSPAPAPAKPTKK